MTDRPDPTRPPDDGGEDGARLRALLGRTAGTVRSGDPLSAVYAVRRRVHRRRLRRVGAASSFALGLAAVLVLVSLGRPTSPPPGPDSIAAAPLRLTGALTSFDGCTDYLAYVKARAEAEVGPYGLNSGPYDGIYPVQAMSAEDNMAAPPLPAGTSAEQAAPVAHSGTTDQVAGVDEPDTVKTDGHFVATLTGSTLRVLDTHAAVLGSLTLAGDTSGGLLLVGDRAVVLSGTSSYQPMFGGPIPTPTLASGAYALPGQQPAQAVVIDLSDPSHPRLVHTFTFDGSVVAARLVGNQIRLVLRSDGPRLAFQHATSPADDAAATAANLALIKASTVADWLPSWQLQSPDGATTPRRQLTACDAVARPQHPTGLSTVSVLSLDPAAGAPGPATSLVAAGDTVYATAGNLVVAGAVNTPRPASTGQPPTRMPNAPAGPPAPCCAAAVGSVTTWLYDFATHGADRPTFLGAGSVPGTLLDSYAIDLAANGILRVASTAQSSTGSTDSRITVLHQSGQDLTTLGVVDGLGNGQQLRAVRFLGDQAYVVTYRRFDPLYVVNLADPSHPAVTGQLEQPGFSEFLYPLPDHRLLGVGVEITGNEPSGLTVATYDVSDPAHPRRIATAPLASGMYPTKDGYDPHAFLYWEPSDLAVLALPQSYDNGPAGAVAYRIGTGGSITNLATLGHATLTTTRSAVIGNSLWAFTPGGVVTASLTSLDHSTWHPYLPPT